MRTIVTTASLCGLLIAGTVAPSAHGAVGTAEGSITAREYLSLTGATVADLTNSAVFPDRSDVVAYPTFFEWPQATNLNSLPPLGVRDDYGVQIAGFFIPSVTGPHIFAVAADEQAVLYLGTNDSPATKVLIAQETSPHAARDYSGAVGRSLLDAGTASQRYENVSAAVTLVQGERYYIEALMKEADGNESLSVSVSTNGTPPQTGIDLPIDGSRLARLPDTAPPTIVKAHGDASFTHVYVTFSEPVEKASAETLENYSFSPRLTIAKATLQTDSSQVVLETSQLTAGADYELTINDVLDQATEPNVIAPNSRVHFQAFTFQKGFLLFEVFEDIAGSSVKDLLDAPKYRSNQPDAQLLLTSFDTRSAYPDNLHDDYGARVSGWITPETTGDYEFFLRSENASQLFISTDDTAGNLSPLPIAEEPECCHPFVEAGSPQTSAFVTLQGGRRYYLMALLKASTGSDFLQIAWRKSGDTTLPALLQPVGARFIGGLVDPTGAFIDIVGPSMTPTTAVEGRSVTLSVTVTASATAIGYQWKKNGAEIPGATQSSYRTPELKLADTGTRYSCEVSVPGLVKTSDELILNVVPDTFPPVVTGSGTLLTTNRVEIGLLFDEALQEVTARDTNNYALSSGVLMEARYVAQNHSVVLSAAGLSPGGRTTVTVQNVRDLKGNAMSSTTNEVVVGTMRWAAIGGTDYVDINHEPASVWPDDAVAVASDAFDLVSGGSTFADAYDEGTFVYEELRGDFDKRVRVEFQDSSSAAAQAGLHLREVLDEGVTRSQVEGGYKMSRDISVCANPVAQWDGAAGGNTHLWLARLVAGGNYSNSGGGGPPLYPNAWVRLKRQGTTFTAYRSDDGSAWTQIGTLETGGSSTAQPFADRLLVGVYYAPQLNVGDAKTGVGRSTLANFREYGDYHSPTADGTVTIVVEGGKLKISWTPADGTLEVADLVDGPYRPLEGVTNPYVTDSSAAEKYYRVKARTVTTPATLTTALEGGKLKLTWTPSGGSLEAADVVQGPYSTILGATSPYLVDPTAGAKYYRVKN